MGGREAILSLSIYDRLTALDVSPEILKEFIAIIAMAVAAGKVPMTPAQRARKYRHEKSQRRDSVAASPVQPVTAPGELFALPAPATPTPKEKKPRAKKEKAPTDADPRHHAITSAIGAAYRASTGKPFAFNPRFAKVLADFLKSCPEVTADEFLDRYRDCLESGVSTFAKHTASAADPIYLCRNWMAVETELTRIAQDFEKANRPKPAFQSK